MLPWWGSPSHEANSADVNSILKMLFNYLQGNSDEKARASLGADEKLYAAEVRQFPATATLHTSCCMQLLTHIRAQTSSRNTSTADQVEAQLKEPSIRAYMSMHDGRISLDWTMQLLLNNNHSALHRSPHHPKNRKLLAFAAQWSTSSQPPPEICPH